MITKNKKAQTREGGLAGKIVDYLPYIILFCILVIAVYALARKVGNF